MLRCCVQQITLNFTHCRKQCQFCPRGTFQDEEIQTVCKLCPADHTTAAQGISVFHFMHGIPCNEVFC